MNRELHKLRARLDTVEDYLRSISPKVARHAELLEERALLIEQLKAFEPILDTRVAFEGA